MLTKYISLLVKLHGELTAPDFQQTHTPSIYRCLAISKAIVPLEPQCRAVAPRSPWCQWVTAVQVRAGAGAALLLTLQCSSNAELLAEGH